MNFSSNPVTIHKQSEDSPSTHSCTRGLGPSHLLHSRCSLRSSVPTSSCPTTSTYFSVKGRSCWCSHSSSSSRAMSAWTHKRRHLQIQHCSLCKVHRVHEPYFPRALMLIPQPLKLKSPQTRGSRDIRSHSLPNWPEACTCHKHKSRNNFGQAHPEDTSSNHPITPCHSRGPGKLLYGGRRESLQGKALAGISACDLLTSCPLEVF